MRFIGSSCFKAAKDIKVKKIEVKNSEYFLDLISNFKTKKKVRVNKTLKLKIINQ